MPHYKLTEDGTIEGRLLPKDFLVILDEKRAAHHADILELIKDDDAPSVGHPIDAQTIELVEPETTSPPT
jgi:hypothetical protein